jgi:hypothetical protein
VPSGCENEVPDGERRLQMFNSDLIAAIEGRVYCGEPQDLRLCRLVAAPRSPGSPLLSCG